MTNQTGLTVVVVQHRKQPDQRLAGDSPTDPSAQPSAVMPLPRLDLHHRHLALSRRHHRSPTTPPPDRTGRPRAGRDLSRF